MLGSGKTSSIPASKTPLSLVSIAMLSSAASKALPATDGTTSNVKASGPLPVLLTRKLSMAAPGRYGHRASIKAWPP